MTIRKTPAEMVDEIMRVGPAAWVPPIPRFVEPYDEAPIDVDWRYFYKALMRHHAQETDILNAVIREMYRRHLTGRATPSADP